MAAPVNKAVWLKAEKAHPFVVDEAPLPSPGPNDIVVKAEAWAINPLETYIQKFAIVPRDYPIIMGNDVAGEVYDVGSAVTKFKRGDRVAGAAFGFITLLKDNSAFQLYPRLQDTAAVKIPSGMDWASGAAVPTSTYTAANGLFADRLLALPLPKFGAPRTGKSVLIWGAASAVGINAVQLAHLAGATVVATASKANFDLVKSRGADHVVDYKSPTVIEDLAAILKGTDVVGAYTAIGRETDGLCADVLKLVGKGLTVVSTVPMPTGAPPNLKFVDTVSWMPTDDGRAIVAFIEEALASGFMKVSPDPVIVGKGLGAIQDAVDDKFKGTSAKKLVVMA